MAKKKKTKAEQYAVARIRGQKAEKEKSAEGRDIGKIPEIKDPASRKKALKDFKFCCEHYFPDVFYKPWSNDHLKAIAKIQRAVFLGELFAFAMPRGSGKTSLCESCIIWSGFTGLHEYIMIIGGKDSKALKIIDNVKTTLETNELLLADFPEIVFPISCLDGQARRCEGQLFNGKRTHIEWTKDRLVFPTIPGSKASACCIDAVGITGNIRGPLFARPDGRKVRPSLVIPDDPQTDASAKNPKQCKKRLDLLNGAILGMAGPDKKIAGLMPLTVICRGDMADEILDPEKNPEWQGERCKMIYKFPDNEKLWNKYREIRADSLRQEKGITLATEFYRENRDAMDEGAEVGWKHRFNKDEISALQHAMNLKCRDEAIFFAEYQNEPLDENEDDPEILLPDDIMMRHNGYRRGEIPSETTKLTCFFDVHADHLDYVVLALWDGFSGAVVDYGVHPGGKKSLRDDGASIQSAIFQGLEFLDQYVIQKDYYGPTGTYRIERCLIDTNYEPDTVEKFCEGKGVVYMQSIGLGIGPDQVPIPERRQKPGEILGFNWMQRKLRGQWRILFDASRWKTFAHRRFLIAKGEKGAMTVWGDKPARHYEFAVQVASSERKEMKQGKSGRTIPQWRHNPVVPNHFLDCYVGALIAGSIAGIKDIMHTQKKKTKRKIVSFAELQRKAKG